MPDSSLSLPTDPLSADGAPDTPRAKFGLGMVAKATVAMLAVGLIPLILFGAITLEQQGELLRAEGRASMKTNAEQIAAQLDEWIDKNVRALETAASLPAITSMRREEQTTVLTALAKQYPWMFITFTIAPDGFNVARSDTQPLINYADREYYKDVIQRNSNLAWQSVIAKTSKKPALVVAVPIRASDTVVGVLAASMNVEDISRIVLNWRAGKTGFAFLVDDTGKVISHAREDYVLAQRRLLDHPLVSAFQADGKPHMASFVSDGADAVGYIQGNRFRWGVAVQQSTDEVMAPQHRTLKVGLALLAIAAALVCFIAILASKMLVRPIVDMTHAAERMSMGELGAPIPAAGKDELGMLAKALERLRKSMVAAMSRL